MASRSVCKQAKEGPHVLRVCGIVAHLAPAPLSSIAANALSPIFLAQLTGVFASHGLIPRLEVQRALLQATQQRLPAMPLQYAGRISHQLAELGMTPPPEWVSALEARVAAYCNALGGAAAEAFPNQSAAPAPLRPPGSSAAHAGYAQQLRLTDAALEVPAEGGSGEWEEQEEQEEEESVTAVGGGAGEAEGLACALLALRRLAPGGLAQGLMGPGVALLGAMQTQLTGEVLMQTLFLCVDQRHIPGMPQLQSLMQGVDKREEALRDVPAGEGTDIFSGNGRTLATCRTLLAGLMSARLAEDSGDMSVSQLPAPASFLASRRALDRIRGALPEEGGASSGRGNGGSGGGELTVGSWAREHTGGERAQMSKAYRFQVAGKLAGGQTGAAAAVPLPVVEARVM
ncbi:MAG: hypothetical protein WDW38_011272 [Sanguina aurantia]